MELTHPIQSHPQARQLWRWAYYLSIFTILYNLAEGLLATILGAEDDAITLFGFGLDSFIELISAAGVLLMVRRIQTQPDSHRPAAEVTALRVTGYAFYGLCIVLAAMAIQSLISQQSPKTTFWGIVISSISIGVMLFVIYSKIYLGKQLQSAPLVADARCAIICVYMSIILLVSSGLYELFRFYYIDAIGTLGLIYYAYQEGKECFEKAAGTHHCHHCHEDETC
ncbi:MAG TPA: hypothetical protein DCM08_10635 [Microscillaceae bacterium]|jgi:divalent metal cation (Fe/Co/Zn/Cd) transporter|nr:hypothetical protein [Microscillaceae bacterium]